MYLNKWKWIYLDIRNPFKTMNKLKGIFKPLTLYFRYSFKEWDYYPVLWCSRPAFIHIMFRDVIWKDKYDTPRFEVPPYIWIHLYKLNIILYWSLSEYKDIDDYWEQALWYLYYCNKDIKKARETWIWVDYKTKQSTWTDEFLTNKIRNEIYKS